MGLRKMQEAKQMQLFEQGAASAPKVYDGPAPTSDEFGAALLFGSRMAVQKRWYGPPPRGMDKEDLASEVAMKAIPRVSKWRAGGPKTLNEHAYISCCNVILDMVKSRTREQRRRDPDDVDLMNMDSTVSLTSLLGLYA